MIKVDKQKVQQLNKKKKKKGPKENIIKIAFLTMKSSK